MAVQGKSGRRSKPLLRVCCLFALVVTLTRAAETSSTKTPADNIPSTAAPKTKEKRSQEDIMFGNQQNNPAGGMVDDLFQSEAAPKNSTRQASKTTSENAAQSGNVGSEQRHTLAELPDRLDYYDYVQTESSESMSPSATAEEDDMEEEDVERNSMLAPHDTSSFDTQKILDENLQIDRNELGEYALPGDEYEPQSLLYRRRKRGAFRRLWSPHEELLVGPGRSPLRRRRAPAGPMRLKRDAASNELLSWLALLHRKPLAAGRRRNLKDISFQELQGMDPEPIGLASSDPGYLYEQPAEEEDFDEGDGFPPTLLEAPLPLPEEGPNGETLDWDLPLRPAPRRRSFYPLDYRYVLLPGTRKRASIFSAPGGHFGAMRAVNRWPGEPQSGRWGNFPLRPTPHMGPTAVRRAPEESDSERLYALASLLAGPPASRDAADFEDRRRRRRSPQPQVTRG